jgi:hypothetical protein
MRIVGGQGRLLLARNAVVCLTVDYFPSIDVWLNISLLESFGRIASIQVNLVITQPVSSGYPG